MQAWRRTHGGNAQDFARTDGSFGKNTLLRGASSAAQSMRSDPHAPPLKPLVIGAAAALIFGVAFEIGPFHGFTERMLGSADAQEATERPIPSTDLAGPSDADRAALRYFAREGDVDRLEAELRRLRALYPNWQPPRDLLDPQGEDLELQRVYDLVGEQRYEEARAAIAERRQRDPAYEPPARLLDILDLADIRAELKAASEANNFREVLRIAEQNERILTCNDVDSIWRVAEAFAQTERPQRAFDAYAYVINSCLDQEAERGASLQKAAATLDPSYVTELFALGRTDAQGNNEFANARLDIIRGAVARGGNNPSALVPEEWLLLLAENARTGADLRDAMLVGVYVLRQGAPVEAAQWFRFALDRGLGADAAEAYVDALRATGNLEDQTLAREVAYQWRTQTPELMEAYLNAMATTLTSEGVGENGFIEVEQEAVDRYVPIVIEQRDANGAQALGWYAFNTCQFIIAEEWFISSANWVPTESAVFGLALSRQRLGDVAGFDDVIDEWGPLYPSVAGLATPVDPPAAAAATAPRTAGDTDEDERGGADDLATGAVICDPEERERLRRIIVEQRERRGGGARPISFTEAGSLSTVPRKTNPRTARPKAATRDKGHWRRPVTGPRQNTQGALFHKVQLTGGRPFPLQPAQFRDEPLRRQPARDPRRQDATRQRLDRDLGGNTTVVRRVRRGLSQDDFDARVRLVTDSPSRTAQTGGGGGSAGGTAAQQALTGRNFNRCVLVTNSAIRSGRLSAEDANARGFCLLELNRPIEAAQAFELARLKSRSGTSVEADAIYGATLTAISDNMTQQAALLAASGPMSRVRRTETQVEILTQRAVAANRAGQHTATLTYLDQRNSIAPLQKDLMILQGFAALENRRYRDASRIFQAVQGTGASPDTNRAVFAGQQRRNPLPGSGTGGLRASD
ncbi:MAG: hypothetical protein AAGB11_05875 [Pseudomonadota bacterium]